MDVWDRERGDPGGTVLPNYFKHHGGRSGKGSDVVSLRVSGGTSWVGLSGGIAQHRFICGRNSHSGSKTHTGPYNMEGGGKGFQECGTTDEPW